MNGLSMLSPSVPSPPPPPPGPCQISRTSSSAGKDIRLDGAAATHSSGVPHAILLASETVSTPSTS